MSVIMEQAAAQPSYTHEKIDPNDIESGYASGQSDYSPSPRTEKPVISLSKSHIEYLNEQMESMHPMDILRFCKIMFPNLYQSTAFGLTGLATMDMLSKIQQENPESRTVDLIFLDTLYHFKETYDGEKFYHNAGDMYDFIVKVEPLQRAYDELKVAAVLNGRRRSQGAARGSIPIIEIDEERNIVKINPMATWTFAQVNQYIKENNVPYNALLDQGYKSVGDWHSTVPVGEGEDERAGRWKGQSKTECGIHNRKSKYSEIATQMESKTAAPVS